MIQRIRQKFIRIALAVLAGAMVLVTLIINAANLVNVRAELYETVAYLAESGANGKTGMGQKNARARRMRNALSESRYYTAEISPNGRITLSDTEHDADASSDEQSEAAKQAFQGGSASGRIGQYIYLVTERGNSGRLAVLLNAETKLAAIKTLALISAAACVGGILLSWLLVSLFSRRAIRPLIQSAVQQKQFITDAGHELKTPLTVIGANMDVLALDLGKNEWVESTRSQAAKMSDLVNQMVYLSRMDEEDAKLLRTAFDVSDAVEKTVQPFVAMSEFYGKHFRMDAADHISMVGDEAAIRRLITILCDNAVKYAPEGDNIVFRCRTAGKKLLLQTENGLRENLTDENLKHLFDRFYRADSSRTKQDTGGTGLGLAIARAITIKHGGSVKAQRTPDGRLLISCLIANVGE